MKKMVLAVFLSLLSFWAFGQKAISDEAIRYQQERMVFQQWDSDKFKPSPGLLGLNPLYWLTWAWHRDYPKHDLRPLGPQGPQTQRLALLAAMQNVEQAYQLQVDTLRQAAVKQTAIYSGLLSDTDPLWLLYYSKQFDPLLHQQDGNLLDGMSAKEKDSITASKMLDWYVDECHTLAEQLNSARATTLERGSRLLVYQRLLDEYRKLQATWETQKQNTRLFLPLSESDDKLKKHEMPIAGAGKNRTDIQIADNVLSQSKL